MGKGMKETIKKVTKKRRNGTKQSKETVLLTGIKQGVGAVTSRPFGSSKPRSGKGRGGVGGGWSSSALNAFCPVHAPLPRAVGGYTVVRSTGILTVTEELTLFGTFENQTSGLLAEGGPYWSNIVAASNAQGGFNSLIDAQDNTVFKALTNLDAPGFNAAQLVPSAMSLQLMNPNALQTTSGIIMCGRAKNVLQLEGDTRTWATLADELVSYTAPRLCAAGKLALRGVHGDLIPYNMSKLADFRPLSTATSPSFFGTWKATADSSTDLAGFAPSFIYNPGRTPLNVLVCVEYRTRFDPSNPAHATHRTYTPTTDKSWSNMVKQAESLGHGFRDIVEVVASMGATAKAGAAAVGL
jgi:hypothetical protein